MGEGVSWRFGARVSWVESWRRGDMVGGGKLGWLGGHVRGGGGEVAVA